VIVDPVIEFDAVRKTAADDIHDSKMAAFRIVNVLYVVMPRQNVSHNSFFQKVNASHFVTININVFSLLAKKRLKKRADVGNEGPSLVL
jgi:hypothetical protein